MPIKRRNDFETLPETIVAEVKLCRDKIFFVLSYCHPNLLSDEFDEYVKSLEQIYENINKENPSITIITGDFNSTSPLFWENDKENREGRVFSNFLISNNMEELINEPTHIRDDGSQSCIDLICTDQPFIFTETGVLPSLDSHSKHNIIHGSLNFHIPCPPPYKRKIWDYKAANTNLIRNDLLNTDWQSLFIGLDASEMSLVFTDTFLNIISHHIPNKIITVNDKDAPWITSKVKSAIRRNYRVYRKWVKRGRILEDHDNVCEVQNATLKLEKCIFGLPSREFQIKRNKQIFHPLLRIIIMCPTFSKSLKYLTITLQSNAKLTIMTVSYLSLSLERMHLYLKLMLVPIKLLILFKSIVPTNLMVVMIYQLLCCNYVHLR